MRICEKVAAPKPCLTSGAKLLKELKWSAVLSTKPWAAAATYAFIDCNAQLFNND